MNTKSWFAAHPWTLSYVAIIVTLELILLLAMALR